MAFDTSRRDAAVANERAQREADRSRLLELTYAALDALAAEGGPSRVVIFGSLVAPGRFTPRSDVDIAVERLEDPIGLAARLSREVGREVHVVTATDGSVYDRAVAGGIAWTRGIEWTRRN